MLDKLCGGMKERIKYIYIYIFMRQKDIFWVRRIGWRGVDSCLYFSAYTNLTASKVPCLTWWMNFLYFPCHPFFSFSPVHAQKINWWKWILIRKIENRWRDGWINKKDNGITKKRVSVRTRELLYCYQLLITAKVWMGISWEHYWRMAQNKIRPMAKE